MAKAVLGRKGLFWLQRDGVQQGEEGTAGEHKAGLAVRKHRGNSKWDQASPTPVPYFLQKTGPPAGGHVFKYMSPLVGVSHLNRSGGYGEVWQ